MNEILLVLFLIISIALIMSIMLQQGNSVDMKNSFGSGSSSTLFGSSGSGNFMTRVTAILAILFFTTSLVLVNINYNSIDKESKWENLDTSVKNEQIQSVTQTKPISDIPQ